jgi:DNA-binding MarR family transcriptional regulator
MEDRRKLIEKAVESIYAIKKKIGVEMHLHFNTMRITHSQWIVLHLVKNKVNISIKDIAGLLGTSSSAATQVVNILVNKGFLFRKRNPDDRRTLKIALTEKSNAEFDSIKNKSFSILSSLFDTLDDYELLKYCELSSKITGSISAELSEQIAGNEKSADK